MTNEKENRSNNFKFYWKSIIDGSLLSREIILKNLWFILYLAFLGLIYIANRNHAERIARQINSLKTEVEELKAEQLSITSKLMQMTQQSEIEKLIQEKQLDLVISNQPPFKISVPCQ